MRKNKLKRIAEQETRSFTRYSTYKAFFLLLFALSNLPPFCFWNQIKNCYNDEGILVILSWLVVIMAFFGSIVNANPKQISF